MYYMHMVNSFLNLLLSDFQGGCCRINRIPQGAMVYGEYFKPTGELRRFSFKVTQNYVDIKFMDEGKRVLFGTRVAGDIFMDKGIRGFLTRDNRGRNLRVCS